MRVSTLKDALSPAQNPPAAQMVHMSLEVAAVVLDDVPFSQRVQLKVQLPVGGDDQEPAGHG